MKYHKLPFLFVSLSVVCATVLSVDPTPVNDAGLARSGSRNLRIPFANAAVAGGRSEVHGVQRGELGGAGMWVYSSIPLATGDVVLKTADSGGDASFPMPVVAVSNRWTWVEFDISTLAGGTGDAVTNVKLALSTAGAARGAFNVNIGGGWKWDADEELPLGVDLVESPGAARWMLAITKASGGTHDEAALTEGTDYFVHHESGNDFLVTISNLPFQAARSPVFLSEGDGRTAWALTT